MQGPAGATAPGLAAAPPFGLEAPCLGQQTTGIHLLPPGRPAPLGPRRIPERVDGSHGAPLVRKGRAPEEVARQFEPSAQAIRNWVKQAALDAGGRTDGLTTEEREELRRLRRKPSCSILKGGRIAVFQSP